MVTAADIVRLDASAVRSSGRSRLREFLAFPRRQMPTTNADPRSSLCRGSHNKGHHHSPPIDQMSQR